MQIVINVDETMFKDVIEGQLAAMPADTIQTIIQDAMVEYLKNSDVIKQVFIYESSNSWGSGTKQEPANVLKLAASKFDISPAFKEVEELVLDELKTNYQHILVQALSNMMLSGFSGSGQFYDQVSMVVRNVIVNMQQNGGHI